MSEEKIAATQRDFNELKNLSQQVRTVRHTVSRYLHIALTVTIAMSLIYLVHDTTTLPFSLPHSDPVPVSSHLHSHASLPHATPYPLCTPRPSPSFPLSFLYHMSQLSSFSFSRCSSLRWLELRSKSKRWTSLH